MGMPDDQTWIVSKEEINRALYMEFSHSAVWYAHVEPSSKVACQMKIIDVRTNFFQVFNMASSGLRKMLFLIILLTPKWHWGMCYEYSGESSETFPEKIYQFKEHLKASAPIYYHYYATGHTTKVDNFSNVRSKEQNIAS